MAICATAETKAGGRIAAPRGEAPLSADTADEVPDQSTIELEDFSHSKSKASNAAFELEKAEHVKAFTQRTGMSPERCWHLVLLLLALRVIGDTCRYAVMLEYTRYYVVNDVGMITLLETATSSPQSLFTALTFPMWGLVADRTSRKKVLVLASVVNVAAAWLFVLFPSIWIMVVMRMMSLIGNLTWTIREAMLRDLFSRSEWERKDGGITGIKSKMAVFSTICMGVGGALSMGLLWLGDHGYTGFPNEFSRRRDDCSDEYCLGPGQQSWDNQGWKVDGSLRLLMVIGTVLLSLETVLLFLIFPETLPPEYVTEVSVCRFIWRRRGDFLTPWNNLRVFATVQLRDLLDVRVVQFIIFSGSNALFMSWYRRHELDSNTMLTMGACTMLAGFFITVLVGPIVQIYGDLRGIWMPACVLGLAYAVCAALVPKHLWYLSYGYMFLFMGPGVAFGGFQPDLISKLMPPDVQGTFQTAKVFVCDIQKMIFVWPWMGVMLWSKDMPYPFDCLSIWIALALGVVVLYMTVRQLKHDPKDALMEGTALEPYYNTNYVKGRWYRRHGGKRRRDKGYSPNSPTSLHEQVATCEGQSKVGLVLQSPNDADFATYLQHLTQQVIARRSLSVVLSFDDDVLVVKKAAPTPSTVSEEDDVEQVVQSASSESMEKDTQAAPDRAPGP